ncbi:unnamed protein product [Bursaphelenchus okinawaensis]|uniref:Protein arginine N-methyltransferase n=1 Tax=Bursaphelenchus okinawaensis TaxID=465554 RepID=A0A811KI41_9BILA|nr:unnamed protein product [Bursaphelenchus okinawaensis]CAG9103459.1 unnamed protein product [Bursaphelenchus okinawaensis]
MSSVGRAKLVQYQSFGYLKQHNVDTFAVSLRCKIKDECVLFDHDDIHELGTTVDNVIGVTFFNERIDLLTVEEDFGNANYLGLAAVAVAVYCDPDEAFLKLLRRFVYLQSYTPYIIILLPSCIHDVAGCSTSSIWDSWRLIRKELFNACYDKLGVGLLCSGRFDSDFIDESLLERWKGEPLKLVANTVLEDGSKFEHLLNVLRLYISPECEYVVPYINQNGNELVDITKLQQLAQLFVQNSRKIPVINNAYFEDFPQRPLKPTEDDLSASVYSTFETITSKYRLYESAVIEAIMDWQQHDKNRNKKFVVLLVGAGRGGLIESILKALQKTKQQRVTVLAVEKNKFAYQTLQKKNINRWNNLVKLINTDLRDHTQIKAALNARSPNMVVSELLGSFACNEVGPDLITTLYPLVNEDTVFIPQGYCNYVAPCFSFRINGIINGGRPDYYLRLSNCCGKNGIHGIESQEYCNLDQLYVSSLNSCYIADIPKQIHCYRHTKGVNIDLDWKKKVEYDIEVDCEINAIAGFFTAEIGSETLTTLPKDKRDFTDTKKSWFPAYFPLRSPIYCPAGTKLEVEITRKTNEKGMWYEWSTIT